MLVFIMHRCKHIVRFGATVPVSKYNLSKIRYIINIIVVQQPYSLIEG